MASYPDRCQHLKINGTQCGSPALRRNRFCFFHKRFQDERIRLAADRKRRGIATFILPVLEDANSIQMALQQVMRLLVSRDIDHKTASLLLYALQTASSNLRQTRFEAYKHDVVLDPRGVANTPLGSNIWEDEDFEEEDEDPELIRVEEEAERAAEAVREKYRKQQEDQQYMDGFYAKHPHLRPQAPQPKTAIAPKTSAQPAPTVPKPPQAEPAPKKKPCPSQQEFETDIDALTRKHYFPNIPADVYNAALKNLDKKG